MLACSYNMGKLATAILVAMICHAGVFIPPTPPSVEFVASQRRASSSPELRSILVLMAARSTAGSAHTSMRERTRVMPV